MKPYADRTARRTTQIVSDVLVLCWVVLCCYLGTVVHHATLTLQRPARLMQSSGERLSTSMGQASTSVSRIPLLGGTVATPLRDAAGTGGSLSRAGQQLAQTVGHLATLLGVLTAAVPIVVVVSIWLFARLRFARRAGAAARFVEGNADLELFALRCMARQPMDRIARISADPVSAWRAGDLPVIRALADLELRENGLRAPAGPGG